MPDNIGISVSYPLPGTPFYEKVKADMRLKSNWKDSDDFEMMFNGSHHSGYYRKLQRFVHKEYRKSQGLFNLRQITKNPMDCSLARLASVIKLGYYVPSAFWIPCYSKTQTWVIHSIRRRQVTTKRLPIRLLGDCSGVMFANDWQKSSHHQPKKS
jgi:hypothetical protein